MTKCLVRAVHSRGDPCGRLPAPLTSALISPTFQAPWRAASRNDTPSSFQHRTLQVAIMPLILFSASEHDKPGRCAPSSFTTKAQLTAPMRPILFQQNAGYRCLEQLQVAGQQCAPSSFSRMRRAAARRILLLFSLSAAAGGSLTNGNQQGKEGKAPKIPTKTT